MNTSATQFPVAMSFAGVNAFAARNLQLLSAIENTLDALDSDIKIIVGIDASYDELRQRLESNEAVIDPDRRIESNLVKASEACSRIYRDARQRHGFACIDPELHPDDGVADAYESFMDAIGHLHDTVEDLREWMASHDAVLEPSISAVFSSADDLFESLMSAK
jgi:hypothetical protein